MSPATESEREPSRRLFAVLVNWNGGALTDRALDSLEASRGPRAAAIVVDNGSVDGSAERLAMRPGVELVRNRRNLGFAAAANQGIRAALRRGADLVFLLNNDAVLEPETLERLVAAAEERPDAGMLAPVILDGEGRCWCAGVDLGFHPNVQRLRGFGASRPPAGPDLEEVDALTGCGLLLRREALEELGLLDERFFVYVEDIDLSLRHRAGGWSRLLVRSARMVHEPGSSTGGGYGAWRKRMLAYNVVLLLRKHRDLRLWTAFLVMDVLSWPLLLLVGLVTGRARAVLAKGRGMIAGILGGRRPAPPAATARA